MALREAPVPAAGARRGQPRSIGGSPWPPPHNPSPRAQARLLAGLPPARACVACAAAVAIAVGAGAGHAEWLRPDPSYQEAQIALRLAARDTAGHGNDVARLDTLGVALLRLNRQDEARAIFRRVLDVSPLDPAASAGLGKLALFRDRLAEAESLLAGPGREEPGAGADLWSARIRRGAYASAAEMAAAAGNEGRAPLLERLAEGGAWTVGGGEATLVWKRSNPVPLVRVRLNGTSVLMALDTGTGDLLVDKSFATRCRVTRLNGEALVFWSGSRVAVRNAVVKRIELGDARVEQVPAGILPLGKWSHEVNPLDEPVAGVIGLNLLRRFTPTLDYARGRLELRPAGATAGVARGAVRVPFEIWGESELTVYGSLAGGRRMALVLATGLPAAGVGAPAEVLEEVGVKPGSVSRMMKGAGAFLGGRPWSEVHVPSVTVGPLVSDRVPGWSGALDAAELWRHGVRRDGMLGGAFFRGRRVTFDWEKRELLVELGD